MRCAALHFLSVLIAACSLAASVAWADLSGAPVVPGGRSGDGAPVAEAPALPGAVVVAQGEDPAAAASGLKLPASFNGDLPCSDCDRLRFRLNLWPDGVFHLRRSWKGKQMARDSIGRWWVDGGLHSVVLSGAGEEMRLKILGPDRLRLTGEDGKGHVLTAAEKFEPFEPRLPLRGMLTYVADEARFTECLTGRDYPLVADGDYLALEHAYLAAGAEAGGAIMASFDGAIVEAPGEQGAATTPMVMVMRFVGVWPGETCERAMGEASLTNTYWKVVSIGGEDLSPVEGRREPNLILREGDPRFTATVGCNQVTGSYTLDGDKLTFGLGATTLMACPPPLDVREGRLSHALAQTAAWRIDGQTLELLDAGGAPLALLQAVYLY